jgi:predicted anti-sigma-YlaC factor YlaD
MDQHLSEFELAAYLDQHTADPDRERIESHLAGCADCRAELAEADLLLRRAGRPRRVFAGVLAVVGMAAAVLLVVQPALFRQGRAESDSLRGEDHPAAIVAYGPIGAVPAGGLRFMWASQPGARSYRLTVTRPDGGTVWTGSTTDTSASLPDSIAPRPGERYLWVVDALLDDGRTRSTGVREFQLAQ